MKTMRRKHSFVSLLVCAVITIVGAQIELDDLDPQRPCEHTNTINLPKDNLCLVPIRTAYTWVTAATTCERAGGSLYQAPEERLMSRPDLMRCLGSMSDARYDDMWINAFGEWSPHFFWTNGSWVNPVEYCTTLPPPREDRSLVPITSDTLSVDYCVSACHDTGASFIVIYNNSKSPFCYCNHYLDTVYRQQCYRNSVDYEANNAYFIVHSRENSLIKLKSEDAFSRTEILCVTVDSNTYTDRQMNSDTCFTRRPFICSLPTMTPCDTQPCGSAECYYVKLGDKCLVRIALAYNWYAARAHCSNMGGDLWNMRELDDMKQVGLALNGVSRYWIGASNYRWKFDGNSGSPRSIPRNRLRCGHMFRERNTGSLSNWLWSDTVCDQQKAFLCQFAKTTFSRDELLNDVNCPWPTPPPDTVPTGTQAPGTSGSGVTSPSSSGAANGTTASTGGQISSRDSSFPIGAVIAAIIAGIVLLTCLGLALAFCNRRYWKSGRFRKVRERLAFIPYFADLSATEYDSNAGMSSVSDHGSQVGLVKTGYHNGVSGYGMSTSFGEQSGVFSSKSLDRKHKEAMDRKLADSQNYLANTSLDDRGYASSTYNTMSNKNKDYMTLQAQMDIKDDAELAGLRESFRRKPEVALATDHADLNFTVNHAVSRSHSHAGSEPARSPLERTMEDIILPSTEGGMGLNLPDRVAEEARLYSTMTHNHNI